MKTNKFIYKFIPYCLTIDNVRRPKIAKDKHKIALEEMKNNLIIMKKLKRELAVPGNNTSSKKYK